MSDSDVAAAVAMNSEGDSTADDSAPVVITAADDLVDASQKAGDDETGPVSRSISDEHIVAATHLVAAPAMTEKEIPGGATSESDADARRKAVGLVDQAAKTTSPIEQATLLTQAIRSGVLDKADEEKAYATLLEANKRGILNPRCDESFMKVEVKKGDSL